jgi:SAM-dependent methyltransferase
LLRAPASWLNDPRAYRVWQGPFARAKLAPVVRHNDLAAARRVLDVGCGPGTNAPQFAGADYLGLDLSPAYVDYARRRYGRRFAVVDVCRDPLPAGSFDFVLVNSLLHHLPTPDVRALLAGLSDRLATGGHVHVLDLVLPDRAGPARLLARWDRGDHPRPLEEWRTLLSAPFEPVVFEPYALPGRGPALWEMVYFKGRRRP